MGCCPPGRRFILNLPPVVTTLSESTDNDLETIRLIDQRQNQVLEDLDTLNQRILDIIDLYNAGRQDTLQTDGDGASTDKLDTAA